MSGHSKWSTIKRKKGAADAKRGKLFTQLIREITMAARTGGGEIDANPRLRLAVDKARGQNMPKENIERAIARGTGQVEDVHYEEVRYEGYGPSGVAVIVDALTDNKNRTVGEVRHLFSRHGGNLGASGCVSFLFEKRGVLTFDTEGLDRDALLEAAIEANAADVRDDPDAVEVLTDAESFGAIRNALESRGFRPANAELSLIPQTTVRLSGKSAQSMLKLFEALDEHDDVKHIFANFDIDEEEMRQLA
jgi:YebC/PmpR family DNA-binding regulatory protein